MEANCNEGSLRRCWRSGFSEDTSCLLRGPDAILILGHWQAATDWFVVDSSAVAPDKLFASDEALETRVVLVLGVSWDQLAGERIR